MINDAKPVSKNRTKRLDGAWLDFQTEHLEQISRSDELDLGGGNNEMNSEFKLRDFMLVQYS